MMEMQPTNSRWAKLCLVPALLALSGCGGGGTPDCGADDTLDVAMDILVENLYMDGHKRELRNDLLAARKEERQELKAEREAAFKADKKAYKAVHRRDGPSLEVAKAEKEKTKAALDEAEAALEKFNEETQAMLNEISGIEASTEEIQDEHNLQLEYVAMTAYNETIDTYQCSARVTSDTWEDKAISYTVQSSATDSDEFFVEVFPQ